MAFSGSWAQEQAPSVTLKPSSQPSAGSVSTELRAADATAAAQVLGNALGATVRIDGAVTAPITLELQGVTGRAALDALATAVRGTWRPVYSLVVGAAPGSTPRPVPVGRTVTVNLSDVSARTALSLVARELAEGLLVAPFPEGVMTGLAYHLVYPPTALDRPPVVAFRAWIIAEARAQQVIEDQTIRSAQRPTLKAVR